jgi:hypothetical protein
MSGSPRAREQLGTGAGWPGSSRLRRVPAPAAGTKVKGSVVACHVRARAGWVAALD